MRARHTALDQLAPKQKVFVIEYLVDRDATRAAGVAGYKYPDRMGVRLLDQTYHPDVVEAIRVQEERMTRQLEVKSQDVVEELCRIAFSNPKDLLDSKGRVKPLKEMPDDIARAVKRITVSYADLPNGQGEFERVKSVEVVFWDKLNALHQLALHLGWLKETRAGMGSDPHKVQIMNWGDLLESIAQMTREGPKQVEARVSGEVVRPPNAVEEELRQLEEDLRNGQQP